MSSFNPPVSSQISNFMTRGFKKGVRAATGSRLSLRARRLKGSKTQRLEDSKARTLKGSKAQQIGLPLDDAQSLRQTRSSQL